MKRYKISRIRPEISLEEAGKMADFEQLVKSHKAAGGGSLNYLTIAKGSVLLVVLASMVYLAIKNDAYELGEQKPMISANEMVEEAASNKNSSPEPVAGEVHEDRASEASLEQQESTMRPEKTAPAVEDEALKEDADTQAGYIEAAPIDGFPALYQYFDENLVYPSQILEEGVEGSVIVRFDIDTEGMASNITIEKSLHQKLDSTALVLISQMPLWHPAMLYGRPIVSTHRIPLFFKIDETAD